MKRHYLPHLVTEVRSEEGELVGYEVFASAPPADDETNPSIHHAEPTLTPVSLPPSVAAPTELGAGLDLEAIRARADAATAGPWWIEDSEQTWVLQGVGAVFPPAMEGWPEQIINHQILKAPKSGTPYAEYWPDEATAAFIVNSRMDVPALVAVVERLTLALEAKTYVARKNNEHFMSVTAELEKRDFDLSTARAEIAELRRIGTPEWEAEQEDAQAEANTERPPDKEYYEHG